MGNPEFLSTNGFFRDIFHQAMEVSQRRVENGEISIVGVNVHTLDEKDDKLLRDVATAKIETWHCHTQKIERFKRERNNAEVRQGLDGVSVAASGSTNLIPPIIAALDATATIGEIVTVMRSALGMPPDLFDHPLPDGGTRQRHVA